MKNTIFEQYMLYEAEVENKKTFILEQFGSMERYQEVMTEALNIKGIMEYLTKKLGLDKGTGTQAIQKILADPEAFKKALKNKEAYLKSQGWATKDFDNNFISLKHKFPDIIAFNDELSKKNYTPEEIRAINYIMFEHPEILTVHSPYTSEIKELDDIPEEERGDYQTKVDVDAYKKNRPLQPTGKPTKVAKPLGYKKVRGKTFRDLDNQ